MSVEESNFQSSSDERLFRYSAHPNCGEGKSLTFGKNLVDFK